MLSSSFVLFCQLSKETNYENLLRKFLAIVHIGVGGPHIKRKGERRILCTYCSCFGTKICLENK